MIFNKGKKAFNLSTKGFGFKFVVSAGIEPFSVID